MVRREPHFSKTSENLLSSEREMQYVINCRVIINPHTKGVSPQNISDHDSKKETEIGKFLTSWGICFQ